MQYVLKLNISIYTGLLLLPLRLFILNYGLSDYLPLIIAIQMTVVYVLLSYLTSSKIEWVSCFLIFLTSAILAWGTANLVYELSIMFNINYLFMVIINWSLDTVLVKGFLESTSLNMEVAELLNPASPSSSSSEGGRESNVNSNTNQQNGPPNLEDLPAIDLTSNQTFASSLEARCRILAPHKTPSHTGVVSLTLGDLGINKRSDAGQRLLALFPADNNSKFHFGKTMRSSFSQATFWSSVETDKSRGSSIIRAIRNS